VPLLSEKDFRVGERIVNGQRIALKLLAYQPRSAGPISTAWVIDSGTLQIQQAANSVRRFLKTALTL